MIACEISVRLCSGGNKELTKEYVTDSSVGHRMCKCLLFVLNIGMTGDKGEEIKSQLQCGLLGAETFASIPNMLR